MKIKKFISVLMVSSIVISSTACSLFGPKITVDEDDAEEFAADFCEAILSSDNKKIKKMSEDKASDYIDELSFSSNSDDDEIDGIYDAWYETLQYEITDVDFDEETGNANVAVEFTYADYESFKLELPSFPESWITAISDCDEVDQVEATIELVYDSESESFHVKAPKKVIEKATALFGESIDGVVPTNNNLAICASWVDTNEDGTYLTTDRILLDVSFSDDYGYFTDRMIGLNIVAGNGSSTTPSMLGHMFAEPYEITPDLFGTDVMPAGTLAVGIEDEDGNFTYYLTVEIEEPETPESSLQGVVAHNPEMAGHYDGTTGVYTNEYFGFSMNFGPDSYEAEESDSTINTANYLRNMNIEPDVFVVDDASSSVWIVSTVTFESSVGDISVQELMGRDGVILNSNGIDYSFRSETKDGYLYECYVIAGNCGIVLIYHYSYSYVPDDGVVMNSVAPLS